MIARTALKWFCIGLIAVGVSIVAIGCGGDDDDSEDGTIIVTNVVDGTTTVVTNVTVVTNAPADEEVVLVAPYLISPADGTQFKVLMDPNTDTYCVTLRWTAVEGALDYITEIYEEGEGYEELNGPDTTCARLLSYGDYEWRVKARDANGTDGPTSDKFTFSIDPVIILP
ncbi:MAG: hypothetical protein AB7V14_11380 [Kiritimatiellia bacterium]